MRFIPALSLVATATSSMASDFARNAAGVEEDAKKGTVGLRGGRDLARGGSAGRGHKGPRPNKRMASKPDKVAPFRPGKSYDKPPLAEEDISDDEEEEEVFEGESLEVDPTPTPPPRKFYRGKEPKLEASKPGKRPGSSGRPSKSATPMEDEGYAKEDYYQTDAPPPDARGWGVQAKEKKAKEKKGRQKRDKPGRQVPPPPDPDPSEVQSFAHEATATGGYERPQLTKDKVPRQPRTKPDKGAPRGSREGDDGPRFGEKSGPKKRVKMAKEEKRDKPKKQGGRAGPSNEVATRGWPPTPAPTFTTPSRPPSPEPTTMEPTTPAPVWKEEEEVEGTEWIVPELPPCPSDYDPSHTSYLAGDAIEMNAHVFVCRDPPHEEYCNVVELDESWDDATKELWFEAWDHAGPCEETEAKTADVTAEEAAEETADEGGDDAYTLIGDEVVILDEMTTPATTTMDAPVATEAPVTTRTMTTTTATESPDTTTTTTTSTTTTTTATTTTTTEEDTTTTAAATEAADPVPTEYPTYAPTGPMPDCPPAYNSAATYAAGDVSEVREHIFECRDELHEPWCNVAEWDSSYISEQVPNAKDLWREAWVHVGPCASVTLEEQMDIEALVEEIEADEGWLEEGGAS